MARYFTQWDADTIGSNVAGWSVEVGGTPGRAPAYGAPPVHRRYLALATQTAGTNTLLSWDAVDADADRDDFDVLTCLMWPATTTDDNLGVFARQSSGISNVYFGLMNNAGGLTIYKVVAGVGATVASAGFTVDLAKSYFLRFRGNGTALKLKAWDAALGAAGEPAAWNIETTDASLSAAGNIGVCCYDAAGTGEIAAFNFFAVGTNGDAAVCPRTNAERTAALKDQTKEFIALAEMAFAKYDASASPYVGTGYWYISKGGYTSHPQDTPANQPYPSQMMRAPTLRRGIDLKLSGEAKLAFGEMKVVNPGTIKQTKWLALPGVSGNYASAPSTAALSDTGNKWLTGVLEWADYTPGANQTICGKFQSGNGWVLQIITTGKLRLYDGNANIDSTVAVPTADGQPLYFAVEHVTNNGSAQRQTKFYTSADQGLTYTQLGSTVLTATALALVQNGEFSIGAHSAGASAVAAGNVRRLRVFNGTQASNTLAGDFDPNKFPNGATTATMPTGETYTVNISGATIATIQQTTTTPGANDDVLRMRWNRSQVIVYYGCRDWPKHDFFKLIVGRLGMPRAESEDVIAFPISDLSDFLNGPVQTKFTTGDRAGQYKPKLFGELKYGWIEPPMTDEATYTFTLSDAAIDITGGNQEEILTISDNGVYLAGGSPAVSAVDTGTETLTFGSAHGALVDALVLPQGLPAPFVDGARYYVISAGFSATALRLSATRGGAAVNITGTTTGGTLNIYNYVLDKAAATVRLLAKPVGRVLMGFIKAGSGVYADQVYSDIVFTGMGLSLNFKDSASFSALNTIVSTFLNEQPMGLWLDTNYRSGRTVLDDMAARTATWYGFTPDGLMQVGQMGLPAATAVRSFNSGAILAKGVKQVQRIRAKDFSSGVQTCIPWFVTRGPMQLNASNNSVLWTQQQGEQLKSSLSAYSYGAAGTPLDDHPDRIDADKDANFDSLMMDGNAGTALRKHLVSLFKTDLGVWEFPLKREAMESNLGETVSIEYERLGFKAYTTADPPSPDNVAAFDARLAVVSDVFFDLDETSGFPVRLQVYRKIPGNYPTGNLN